MMKIPKQQHYRFSIQINQQHYLRYYQGAASTVQVFSECGRRLRFPASRLRPFLTHNGIFGRFQLTISNENRFIDLKKLS